MKHLPFCIFVTILGLTGCGKSSTPAVSGPAATVTLKDGSNFSGSVTKSDTSTITLQSATGESRTYPMTEVATVQYGEQPPGGTPPVSAPLASRNPSPTSAPPVLRTVPMESPQRAVELRPVPPPVARPAQRVEEIRTIPAGTILQVRNNETISSETANAGQTFSAVVAQDVVDSNGRVAIPKGSDATLIVREAVAQGKIEGRSELVLDLGSVSAGGRSYRLETVDLVEKGKEGLGKNKRSAIFAGGGGALGGIIGAVAGGGKGAAIGALSGVAAGTAAQAVTRGKGLKVPSETLLNFKLEAPVQIRGAR